VSADYLPPTGEELRTLLDRLDLSRQGAADLLVVDRSTVARWLTGDRQMPYAALCTLIARCRGWCPTPESWRTELDRAAAGARLPRRKLTGRARASARR